jgi:hypothetical protein
MWSFVPFLLNWAFFRLFVGMSRDNPGTERRGAESERSGSALAASAVALSADAIAPANAKL